MVVDGVDYVLMKVQQALTSRLVQVNLPMIGDKLADLADFIGDIREDVIREIQERFDEALHRTPVVIQIALFDALGPDGLDILADKDASGTITRDDITVVLTDTDIDGQADDQVDIDLAIGKSIALVDESIDFDLGIPAPGVGRRRRRDAGTGVPVGSGDGDQPGVRLLHRHVAGQRVDHLSEGRRSGHGGPGKSVVPPVGRDR